MKAKELIKQLNAIDPTGEIEVFSDGGDIHYADALPWFYDGKPGILIKDEARTGYNVIGIRQINVKDGNKVYLKSLSLEDLAYENYDSDKEFIVEGDDAFKERYSKYCEEAKEL